MKIEKGGQGVAICGVSSDLALEAHAALRAQTGGEIPGVAVNQKPFPGGQVTVVEILNDTGAQRMGKPVGRYVTIEAPGIRQDDPNAHTEIVRAMTQELALMLNLPDNAPVLIVGLGNWNATPDALGPRVVDTVMVTRHVFEYVPDAVEPGMRPVSAIAPGVLGITGLETAEVVEGIVSRTNPAKLIVIDALAAGSVERIASSIQIANTGIRPGSGLGNKRRGLTQETMGVPVISIGVPTVVHAALIVNEAISRFYHATAQKDPPQQQVEGIVNQLLQPFGGALMVTPKEIDALIQNCAKIIAGSINAALHKTVKAQAYAQYLQ